MEAEGPIVDVTGSLPGGISFLIFPQAATTGKAEIRRLGIVILTELLADE
jgi:hypothetical protein